MFRDKGGEVHCCCPMGSTGLHKLRNAEEEGRGRGVREEGREAALVPSPTPSSVAKTSLLLSIQALKHKITTHKLT